MGTISEIAVGWIWNLEIGFIYFYREIWNLFLYLFLSLLHKLKNWSILYVYFIVKTQDTKEHFIYLFILEYFIFKELFNQNISNIWKSKQNNNFHVHGHFIKILKFFLIG